MEEVPGSTLLIVAAVAISLVIIRRWYQRRRREERGEICSDCGRPLEKVFMHLIPPEGPYLIRELENTKTLVCSNRKCSQFRLEIHAGSTRRFMDDFSFFGRIWRWLKREKFPYPLFRCRLPRFFGGD